MSVGSFFEQELSNENTDYRIQVFVRLNLVELKEQWFAPTLAHKLGDVPHVSGLLRRIESTEQLALEEYVYYVKDNVDLLDQDSIASSAPKFRALLNNRKLITDVLNRELQDWGTFQQGIF